MHKLSDSQRIMLSHAARRDDGAANPAETLKSAAAAKVVKSLIARKLMREVRAKPAMPVWRCDAQGRLFSLVISNAGRKIIGVADPRDQAATDVRGPAQSSSSVTATGHRSKRTTRRKTSPAPNFKQSRAPVVSAIPGARAGTKKALLLEMLNRSAGASIDALTRATGWLPQTTRAALTGLRHAGFSIERFRRDDGVSAYRLLGGAVPREGVNVSSERHDAVTARA